MCYFTYHYTSMGFLDYHYFWYRGMHFSMQHSIVNLPVLLRKYSIVCQLLSIIFCTIPPAQFLFSWTKKNGAHSMDHKNIYIKNMGWLGPLVFFSAITYFRIRSDEFWVIVSDSCFPLKVVWWEESLYHCVNHTHCSHIIPGMGGLITFLAW